MNNMSGKDHTSFTNCAEYSVDNVLGDITEFLQNYGHCFYKFCDTETQSQSFTSCSRKTFENQKHSFFFLNIQNYKHDVNGA